MSDRTTPRLPSIYIEGFRAFSRLEVPAVGDVNLVVGRNNVGKTTLLEAVDLYIAGDDAPYTLRNLLRRREEYDRTSAPDLSAEPRFDAERIFHTDGTQSKTQLLISPTAEEEQGLLIARGWMKYVDEENLRTSQIIKRPLNELPPDADVFPALSFETGDAKPQVHRLDRLFKIKPLRRPIVSMKTLRTRPLLSEYDFINDRSSLLWDKIVLTDREAEVIKALQIVDPSIRRISMVDHPSRQESRVALVKRDGQTEPEPLKSLGDGMNRLFELALSMVNCAHGFFLVDEVESGIHFSVQADLWRFLITTAQRLDIQIFATTHSWDCIQAFQTASGQSEADCKLIRLKSHQDHIVADVFDGDELAIIARENIEVR